jgi:hypothetical protein
VCDDADGELELVRVRLRQNSARPGKRENGNILVRGELIVASPEEPLDPAGGVSLRIADGLSLDVEHAWSSFECTSLRSGRVTCRNADRTEQVKFEPLSAKTSRMRFAVTLKRLGIEGPFAPDVIVRLTHDPPIPVIGIDRLGTIASCRVTRNALVCN